MENTNLEVWRWGSNLNCVEKKIVTWSFRTIEWKNCNWMHQHWAAKLLMTFRLSIVRNWDIGQRFQTKGLTNCGAFAISFMTSLAHDQDPCRISYKLSKWEHLVDCFTKMKLINFPRVISCFLSTIFISNIFDCFSLMFLEIFCTIAY